MTSIDPEVGSAKGSAEISFQVEDDVSIDCAGSDDVSEDKMKESISMIWSEYRERSQIKN